MGRVTTADELRALLGEPSARVASKDRARPDDVHRRWLAASPLCLVATSADAGSCDTLRFNGRARLVADAPFFDRMVVKGHLRCAPLRLSGGA